MRGAADDQVVARWQQAHTALHALGSTPRCPCDVVGLAVDGMRWFAHFSLNGEEHRRRSNLRVGAAANTGLLHALWSLPEDVPIPSEALARGDASTIEEKGGGFVDHLDGRVIRRFRPAGSIKAVITVAPHLGEAVDLAAQLPPIYRRIAAASRVRQGHLDADVERSVEFGIGAVLVGHLDEAQVLAAPRDEVRGSPGVYRWWITELAYRNWLYANCAH